MGVAEQGGRLQAFQIPRGIQVKITSKPCCPPKTYEMHAQALRDPQSELGPQRSQCRVPPPPSWSMFLLERCAPGKDAEWQLRSDLCRAPFRWHRRQPMRDRVRPRGQRRHRARALPGPAEAPPPPHPEGSVRPRRRAAGGCPCEERPEDGADAEGHVDLFPFFPSHNSLSPSRPVYRGSIWLGKGAY